MGLCMNHKWGDLLVLITGKTPVITVLNPIKWLFIPHKSDFFHIQWVAAFIYPMNIQRKSHSIIPYSIYHIHIPLNCISSGFTHLKWWFSTINPTAGLGPKAWYLGHRVSPGIIPGEYFIKKISKSNGAKKNSRKSLINNVYKYIYIHIIKKI